MKRIFTFVLLLLLVVSLSGCYFKEDFNIDNDPGYQHEIPLFEYRVNYYVDGVLTYYATNYENQKIKKPNDPVKDNHKFSGWYTDDGKPYDFDSPLLKSFNLYARFEMDYAKIINLLSTEYISTNVKIFVKHWDTLFLGFGRKNEISGIGSGVVIGDEHGNYYVLTNNHVIYDHKRSNHEYIIQDYKGNTYTANLLKGANKAEYDLATLYFKKGKEELKVSKFAKVNPLVFDEIIALGQPEGQNNSITFGQILGYMSVYLDNVPVESSNVTFNVIRHSAPTAGGSSGGVLLNSNFEIVAIHYAGPKNQDFDKRTYGFSIPVEKVLEYLKEYVYV